MQQIVRALLQLFVFDVEAVLGGLGGLFDALQLAVQQGNDPVHVLLKQADGAAETAADAADEVGVALAEGPAAVLHGLAHLMGGLAGILGLHVHGLQHPAGPIGILLHAVLQALLAGAQGADVVHLLLGRGMHAVQQPLGLVRKGLLILAALVYFARVILKPGGDILQNPGHLLHAAQDVHGGVHGGAQAFPIHALGLVDGGQGLAQLGKLPVQGAVHAGDKAAHNMIQPLQLRLGLGGDIAADALGDGGHAVFHGLADALGHFAAQFADGVAQESRLVLLLDDGLHVVAQRPLHDELGEGLIEGVDAVLGGADARPVQDIKKQGAGAARNGGAKGEIHAADHLGDARHGVLGAGQIQAAQAPHQADEGAQDAQGCQNARDHIAQLGVAVGVDHGVVVDVILHVAVDAPAVQLLRVHQKPPPGGLHGPAQEQRVLPHGTLAVPQGHDLQLVHRPTQKTGAPAAGKNALGKPHQGDDGDGAIYEHVGQAARQAVQNFRHTDLLPCLVSPVLYRKRAGNATKI